MNGSMCKLLGVLGLGLGIATTVACDSRPVAAAGFDCASAWQVYNDELVATHFETFDSMVPKFKGRP